METKVRSDKRWLIDDYKGLYYCSSIVDCDNLGTHNPNENQHVFFDFPELKGQSTGPSCISGDGFLSLHTFREVNPLRVLYVLRQNETPGAQMGLS